MNWLHTWTGVLLGGVLFAVFWMGSLSVFDAEIDRWMAPVTRLAMAEAPLSFDALRASLDDAATAKSSFWFVAPPTERQSTLRVSYRQGANMLVRHIDPASGKELPALGTLAATGFLYPFHYSLHIRAANLGVWLVGLAGMAMLALCVSGIVIHRRIFADFFTFRAEKRPRRMFLDLHHVSAVLGLPFNVVITLSGLTISYLVYFPGPLQVAYDGDEGRFVKDAYSHYERKKVGKPGEVSSLDGMTEKARGLWGGDAPRFLSVHHPGDAGAVVEIVRPNDNGVTAWADVVYFDAASGELLHERTHTQPVMGSWLFGAGIHLIQFRHWTLRWAYFALGLSGCVMIAAGYLFWLESRRKRHRHLGLSGVRIVEGMAAGSTSGIVMATLAFFVANRVLPPGATFFGQERAALEIWTFYLVWLGNFCHAWLRARGAWGEQCWAIAALAAAAVLLNWLTTGDHLLQSLWHRHLWSIAGMDLLLLAGAVASLLVATRLQRRRRDLI